MQQKNQKQHVMGFEPCSHIEKTCSCSSIFYHQHVMLNTLTLLSQWWYHST